MAEQSQSAYRSIFKATSLFGGLQVFQIIINVIKSKFVAVLLGTTGIGIMGLYQNALTLVQSVTSMGLSQSAVRDISEAHGTDEKKLGVVVKVTKRLVWLTGFLGLIAVVVLSPLLSKSSFGDYSYIVPFIILSVTLLLDQLTSGQRVILQGTRRLKSLASVSALGSVAGLVFIVPLYFFWGARGIVPAFIVNSGCLLLLSWWQAKKIPIQESSVPMRDTFKIGRQMLVMGIAMSVSAIVSSLASYIIRGYIQHEGGLEAVGLFQAGFILMNTYIGLIANSISTDFYPRLAAVNSDNHKCKELCNQQMELTLLILAPMLTLCLLFMPLVIQILYSRQFLPATGFVQYSVLGVLFRMCSTIIGLSFIVKAESKLFILLESFSSLLYVLFSILGYHLAGLEGLGAGSSIHYFLYLIVVAFIAYRRYDFQFSRSSFYCFFVSVLLTVGCLLVIVFSKGVVEYMMGGILVVLSFIVALRGINRRIGLTAFIKNRFKQS